MECGVYNGHLPTCPKKSQPIEELKETVIFQDGNRTDTIGPDNRDLMDKLNEVIRKVNKQ